MRAPLFDLHAERLVRTGLPSTNELYVARSSNGGLSFSPEAVASGNLLTGAEEAWLNGQVRAVTLSMTRYNGIENSIGVVWHEDTGSSTEVGERP